MPERIMLIWHGIELKVMSLLSFALMFSFSNVFAVFGGICSTIYWVRRIKREEVNKYYSGSWWKWIKSFINK